MGSRNLRDASPLSYRTPAPQAAAEKTQPHTPAVETPPKSDATKTVERLFYMFVALVVLGLVAILTVDCHRADRCEKNGHCDAGTATWVDSKCVCVVYAK